MAYGFTPQGFVVKPQATIISEINAAVQAALGAQANLLSATVIDALRGTFSGRETSLWQLLQSLANMLDPDVATDVFFDNILALSGASRLAQTKSTVSEVLIGTNSTVVPQGTQVSTVGTAIPFSTNASATIATLSAWVAATVYAVGALVTNGGNIYSATIAGASAGSGGPTGTGTSIVDGTVTWFYCGAGSAAVAAACSAVNYGPNVAPSGTLTTIVNPVGGLSSVVNPLDAAVGRNIETDSAGRIRRNSLLHAGGNAAYDAIRAAILNVSGVTSVNLLSNDTDAADGNGVPPHAVEPIVSGTATAAAILAAIHASKGAGINTNPAANTSGAVLDSQGGSHTYYFTTPTGLNIYIAITAAVDSTVFDATNGPGRIKQNLVNFSLGTLLGVNGKLVFAGYKSGDSVVQSPLYQAVFLEPGVKDVSALFIGTAPSPTLTTTIPVGVRQIAKMDTSRITFNGV